MSFENRISGGYNPIEGIGRDKVGGVIVSTILTPDAGYETAIVDEESAKPVERYKTRTDAATGHRIWCERASSLTSVNRLGLFNIEDKIMQIVRK